jgi:H+/Cl- antiporter ClcA
MAVTYLRVVALAALIGIPAAVAAALFLGLIHALETWLWHDLPAALGFDAPPWFLIVGLPVVGALLVVAARQFLPGDGGHSPLEGLKAGETPRSQGRRHGRQPRLNRPEGVHRHTQRRILLVP